jgi:protein TonB
MFDKLVESAKQKQGRRAKRLFLVTGVIYAVALTAFGVATIVGFKPALAEEYNVILGLVPPPPGNPQPPPVQLNQKTTPYLGFVEPKKPTPVLLPDEASKIIVEPRRPSWTVDGGPDLIGLGRGDGVDGGSPMGKEPPPPPPTPTPVAKPVVTPTPDQVVRLTSVLTQGRALRKVQPPYPAIARQARVQGSVQVQISISETGEVTSVTLLSGHPLLREVALQAARQWLFIPTELNGRPVRAIGVITFNFTLN